MKQFVVAFVILAAIALCSGKPNGTKKDVDSDKLSQTQHVIKERAAQLGLPFLGSASGSQSQASSHSESGSIGGGLGPLNLGISGSKSASQSSASSGSGGLGGLFG